MTIEDALSEIGHELPANAVEVLVPRVRKALIERSTGSACVAVFDNADLAFSRDLRFIVLRAALAEAITL